MNFFCYLQTDDVNFVELMKDITAGGEVDKEISQKVGWIDK